MGNESLWQLTQEPSFTFEENNAARLCEGATKLFVLVIQFSTGIQSCKSKKMRPGCLRILLLLTAKRHDSWQTKQQTVISSSKNSVWRQVYCPYRLAKNDETRTSTSVGTRYAHQPLFALPCFFLSGVSNKREKYTSIEEFLLRLSEKGNFCVPVTSANRKGACILSTPARIGHPDHNLIAVLSKHTIFGESEDCLDVVFHVILWQDFNLSAGLVSSWGKEIDPVFVFFRSKLHLALSRSVSFPEHKQNVTNPDILLKLDIRQSGRIFVPLQVIWRHARSGSSEWKGNPNKPSVRHTHCTGSQVFVATFGFNNLFVCIGSKKKDIQNVWKWGFAL